MSLLDDQHRLEQHNTFAIDSVYISNAQAEIC